ncbi:MAG TPA: hypothetical protein VG326_17960 [Tepidisphaeraceae bacterium]|nr:hypothetical protein [Tepidisphaeraceae bacterium]
MSVDVAIYRVRRDITLSVLLKALLIAAVFVTLVFAPPAVRAAAIAGIIVLWIALSVTSARSSLIARNSPALIASGQFDEAERQIESAMRAFTLFGPAKLKALHQLAILRHAQRRWPESAAICRALLGHRLGRSASLTKPVSLILTEALLELNDLPSAYGAIMPLYGEQLSLDEALRLLSLQLDYEAKIGAWPKMFDGAVAKVQLAELMPSPQAARAQSLLALAALKCGRGDWSLWLRGRAELLIDVSTLTTDRPALAEVWSDDR